jgi:anti-sigma B factor antagonist
MDLLNISETQVSDQVTTFTLARVLDNNNAESVVQAITAAQERGCRFLIFDCTNLEFLSSAGVGAILGTIEVSRSKGGDIVLCHVSDTIAHVLKVLDVLDFLTIRRTKAEALSMCNDSHPCT